MRVCLVSYEFPPSGGGEASYVHGLATGLGRTGHEVTVLAPHAGQAETTDQPFRIVPIGRGRAPIRGAGFLAEVERKISSLTKQDKIDLVHVTFDYPTFFVRLGDTVPCVATVHHLHKVEALSMLRYETNPALKILQLLKGSVLTSLEGDLVRQCAAVIAVSEFTAESVQRHLSVPNERMSVVKNGIEASKFEHGDPKRFRTEFPRLTEKMVLYVGRLERSKGLDYLVPAFARASARIPGATLAIVGGGTSEYVKRLKALARGAGVGDKVLFTGRIRQSLLRDAYAASSLLVLPSLMEGFGISLLESMAASRPCVATRVGAIPEVVKDGESGLLVNPADPRELGDALVSILSDQRLGSALGKEGKEVVSREYTVEKMVGKTVEVYQGMLDGITDGKKD